MLLVEGYFVIDKLDMIQHLVKHFNSLNKTVAFTLSATFMVENFHDKMVDISSQSTIVFCNNEEAEIFSKSSSKNVEDQAVAIHKLFTPCENRLLVITCGKDPVHLSRYNYKKDHFDFTLKSYVEPIHTDEIVDTNGCGDGKQMINISFCWRIPFSIYPRKIT